MSAKPKVVGLHARILLGMYTGNVNLTACIKHYSAPPVHPCTDWAGGRQHGRNRGGCYQARRQVIGPIDDSPRKPIAVKSAYPYLESGVLRKHNQL